MEYTRFIHKLIPGICICLLSAFAAKSQQSRPNVIYIMSDDHGYQAVSAYGYGLNKTPNIDALAQHGVRFNRAFVTNSICGPSRAVMLTGQYNHLNGMIDNDRQFDSTQNTVARILQGAGYQTAIVGKWHLGTAPQGFNYSCILPGQGNYYNPEFIEQGVQRKIPGYVTNITTDLALTWLDKRDKNKPFFLIYQQKAPHRNWMPEEKYYHLFDSTTFPVPATYFDDYSTRTRAAHEQEMSIARHMDPAYDLKLYSALPDSIKGLSGDWRYIYNRFTPAQKEKWNQAYGPGNDAFHKAHLSGKALDIYKYQRYIKDYLRCVQSVDDNVGRLMTYLKENGLDKNTIIIYTSDQGFYLGEHGWFDKRFMYEESLRTPLIVSWPGVTNTTQVSEDMVMNLDYAETILDMTGTKIPASMQGKSFVPVLKGQQKGVFRDAIYYHYYEVGVHNVAKHVGVRTNRYKLIYFYENKEWEFYDLEKDKQEVNNSYSNPAYKKEIALLKKRLVELKKQYKDNEVIAGLE
ncbi:sulfatase family protein [Chitinophaga niastensis]|nr:sulfatase [Chitinophaga niastensis]